jgi:LmbE family N-acetylglucosaminyl deacetylase
MSFKLELAARTLLLAAHPDDEVIGTTAVLPLLQNLTIVHATDGSPADRSDRKAYAQVRRYEVAAALSLAGAGHARLLELGFTDQQGACHLVDFTKRLVALLKDVDQVLTHPYEGGHPDHDACAFAAHAAIRCSGSDVKLIEFTSYHAGPTGLTASEFLDDGAETLTIELTQEQRARKREILASYVTQAETLQYFPIAIERFRPAPSYDFTRPPHDGRLFYENYNWGMSSGSFCKLARDAMRELGLCG